MKRGKRNHQEREPEMEASFQNSKNEPLTAGIVHKISLENFLCHDHLELEFNQHINFIIGKNGSGKSAILTGIVIALGERASGTCRGQSLKDFIKTGRNKAVVKVTLLNKGLSAYQNDVYGDLITVERSITMSGSGGYRILNEQGRLVTNKRQELNRILTKMNLQVDNPVCILNQETAKNFLHSNDPKQKFKLFERATQMDIMSQEFSTAEEELSRSKSCMKEKLRSLEGLQAEVKKWRTRNEWYEAINEVHEQKAKLENMIAWAQVEDWEKQTAEAKQKTDDQKNHLERLEERIEAYDQKLMSLKEKHQASNAGIVDKAAEINAVRDSNTNVEREHQDLQTRQRKIQLEIRQIEVEIRRHNNDKQELTKAIAKLQQTDDSEFVNRREKRLNDIEELKAREEVLNSSRRVSEHSVDQLKGAVNQYRNENYAVKSEEGRFQRDMDSKLRMLTELKKNDANQFSVFGNWVPTLLDRIQRTRFRCQPKGPVGAFIKLRDKSWAPAVENLLMGRLNTFICSCDEDARQLNALIDQVVQRGPRPIVVTIKMIGKMYNVQENKVYIDEDLRSKDIHCLLDMLIIEDPDIANILIDMHSVEQILLIRDDKDARHYLMDSSRTPHNCRMAITKGGNTYHPDPNYRTYSGKVGNSARYLQASVEDTIRNLEEEISGLRREVDQTRAKSEENLANIRLNETELRIEEAKLSATRREFNEIRDKMRLLESQQEPEPTDVNVQALEEDLQETESKIQKKQEELQLKLNDSDKFKVELQQVKQNCSETQKKIASLSLGCDPLRDKVRMIESKLDEIKQDRSKILTKKETMLKKQSEFEIDYETARKKAEFEAENAERLSPRVPVTKTLKTLNCELKQIILQLQSQEKEFGTREYVLTEYRRRKQGYDAASSEVINSQRSLKKMSLMAKQRKEFIAIFRESIMLRTHYAFQALLRTRNFEGQLKFDSNEKSLILMVTPPGREGASQPPTPKRSRVDTAGTDIRSLSGGERSFATVCFILSLWDAIESPFRVLDEFDVFMDHVNRRISMDLLINEASTNAARQYIFLTPLGLENLEGKPNLFVFKMDNRNDEPSTQSQLQ